MQVAPQGGPHHAFLFMSDPNSSQTTVMRLGDGMERVVPDDNCGIMFTAPTVAAANILDDTRIIQVQHSCWTAACLVDNAVVLQCLYCRPGGPALPCPALPCPREVMGANLPSVCTIQAWEEGWGGKGGGGHRA